jgi:hypothetical protein
VVLARSKNLSTGQVVWIWDCESQVMVFFHPIHWHSVLVHGQLAEIAFCPQSLVDTSGNWKNGPAYAN